MIRTGIQFLLMSAFISGCLFAQEIPTELRQAITAIEGGKMLQGIALLEPLAVNNEIAREMLGQIYPFVGEYEKAKAIRPTAAARYKTEIAAGYELSDAVDAILSEAKQHRIVIINEAHDAPEHRNFISRIVMKLKDIGFTHYAFETLAEDSEQLRARGYPIRSTGMYSQEPQFGELIRDSIKVGLIPISYESEEMEPLNDPVDEINRREQRQCQNLFDRLLEKNPDARVLIHVGLDHAMEEPKKAGNKEILWFAARLKKLTGIDPLTVDQITSLKSVAGNHNVPSVAQNAQKQFYVGGPFRGYVDMQVFHPPVTLKFARSMWLVDDTTRRMIDVPPALLPKEGRLLIQARPIHESADCIPSDQILAISGVPCAKLSIRPGSYKIETQDELGAPAKSLELVVK